MCFSSSCLASRYAREEPESLCRSIILSGKLRTPAAFWTNKAPIRSLEQGRKHRGRYPHNAVANLRPRPTCNLPAACAPAPVPSGPDQYLHSVARFARNTNAAPLKGSSPNICKRSAAPLVRGVMDRANLASDRRGVGMGSDGKMDVQLDVSKASRVSRLEVLEGPTGRRKRSAAEKARIAAESLVPGAEVATVARKHGVTRWQVYDWRRRLQRGQLSLPDSLAVMFAPLVVDEMPKTRTALQSALVKLEIMVGDVVIRTEVEVEHLAGVVLAMRSSR